MARHPGGRVLMSAGPGTGKHAPAQPCPSSPLTHRPPADPCPDRQVAAREEADLDAYITQIVAQAPPLSTRQRDKLALILRGQPHR